MKYALIIGAVIVVIVATILIISFWKRKSSAPSGQSKLAELDELKSKGLITAQEYEQKRAEITAREGGKNE